MRLLKLSAGLVALGCFTATPAYSGQRDHQIPLGVGVGAGASVEQHPAGTAETHDGKKTTDVRAGTEVSARISANPALGARLQPLLPAGMTFDAAAKGFRTEGQFIAALHASQNLGIPFAQLKSEMTGRDHDNLGLAIHELKPTVDARAEATKAEGQAKTDVQVSTRPTLAQRIEANASLVARLQPLLPPGMTLDAAAKGFRSEGQFIAVLHASTNLGLSFDELKAELIGPAHDSLGQAIHQLKLTADAVAEARKAEAQASADLQASDKDRDDR
jgi:hypothetical protein